MVYLGYVTLKGERGAIVAPSIRIARNWLAEYGAMFEDWRLHDGNGWCDGTDNAWNVISSRYTDAKPVWN